MAPKTEPTSSRTVAPSLFSGPPLGTKYQIVGGSGVTSYEETRKRLNDLPDFIPERGYRGYDLRDLELIPGLPNDIVAEFVWPRIREGDNIKQVKNLLKMRLVSKFWCAFMDHSDLMDQVMMEKYNRVGPRRFSTHLPDCMYLLAYLRASFLQLGLKFMPRFSEYIVGVLISFLHLIFPPIKCCGDG